MLAGIRDRVLERRLAIADPDEVAQAVQSIARDDRTGVARMVQAGQPPTPVAFPTIELSRTGWLGGHGGVRGAVRQAIR
jgi:hypothetical protein